MDTTEKDFETTIEDVLIENGFQKRSQDHYDRSLCIDPEIVVNFIRSTQIIVWNKLKEQYGSDVKERFIKRLIKEIGSRGTLDVLRKGINDVGCKFDLAYFKPENGLNPKHQTDYKHNIFSVIRQLHYSEKNEKSIDIVLFLNGLPIFTAELKNPLKNQDVKNAIAQYRKDRSPKEPLLKFQRCLAHFAIDTDFIFMTTRLSGLQTRFLPFNRGTNHGAGNPPNPDGFMTAYFWEDVLKPDNILELINHFLRLVNILDDDGKPTGKKQLIFPRFHQLDTTRSLIVNAKSNGAGHSYLIEHSAGSGKSNTIAWLAHQLTNLFDDKDKRVFNTIIIITDRRVLDWQLRQTVQSFEQTKGIVSVIDTQKSTKLAEALAAGKKIIITTIQTFPFVTDKITEIKGNKFAVIIDEAHSSQTGETARTMKQTLASNSLPDAEDEEGGDIPDSQDEINKRIEEIMKKSGRLPNVSFFAFTATPKSKTLELFGSPQADGSYKPFKLYSMRQAIQEKFILDVLRNYTTFKAYFALHKQIEDDPKFPKKKAIAKLRSYVDLHDHSIRSKAEIIIEHFNTQIKNLIDNQAKAMVVTRSRLHAVRYKQAFNKILKDKNLNMEAIVAFSGTVTDPDTRIEFTEAKMNGFPDTQTATTFKLPTYKFLIVAEKFQTGFDQPLLHTMYVDKKLSGVNAVQTLSRLNRKHLSKEETMVLDFTNDIEDIKMAFQPYYRTTILSEATDPNKLYDLKRISEEFQIFTKQDVDNISAVYFSTTGTQQMIRAILDPIVNIYKQRDKLEREEFKKSVDDYVRLYSFLSHVIKFQDIELEKTYQILRHLRPLLPAERTRLPEEITDLIDMDSHRIQQTSTGDILLENEDGELLPASETSSTSGEDEKSPLSVIIEYMNDNFGTDFTDADKARYFTEDMERRLSDQPGLKNSMNPTINQSEENRRLAFNDYFEDVLHSMFDSNREIYQKVVDDKKFGDIFKSMMFLKLAEKVGGTVNQ